MSENTALSTQQGRVTLQNYIKSPAVLGRFSDVLGSKQANGYIASVLIAVANGPQQLQTCTPQSIVTSAMRAASLSLSVDQSAGQAYLVPFGGVCTLIVGYRGLLQMAMRTGKYRFINVDEVYEGMNLVKDFRSGFYKITGNPTSRTVVGIFGAFELRNGYAHEVYWTIEEIHEHAKKYSKSYGDKKSPWTTHARDMEKKTVLRALLKYGYLDPHDKGLLEAADEVAPDYVEGDVRDVADQPRRTEASILSDLGFEPESEPESKPGPIQQAALDLGGEVKSPYPPVPADWGEFYAKAAQPPFSLDKKAAGEFARTHTNDLPGAWLAMCKAMIPE